MSTLLMVNDLDRPVTAIVGTLPYGIRLEIRGRDDTVFVTFENSDVKGQPKDARAALQAFLRPLVEFAVEHSTHDPAQLEIQTLAPPSDPDAADPLAAELASSLATARATKAGMDAIVGALNLPKADAA